MRRGQNDGVRQAQTAVTSSPPRGALRRPGIEGHHADPHRSNRFAGIGDAVDTCKGHHRLAVGTGWDYELRRRLVSGIDVIYGTPVMSVCVV